MEIGVLTGLKLILFAGLALSTGVWSGSPGSAVDFFHPHFAGLTDGAYSARANQTFVVSKASQVALVALTTVSALPPLKGFSSPHQGRFFNSQSTHSTQQLFSPSSRAASDATLASPTPYSITLSTSFEGLGEASDNTSEPAPDAQVAVGPNHVMEMVNVLGDIFSKNGRLIQNFTLSSFFATGNAPLSDPKMLFDAPSGRWFASILGGSYLAIAVSSKSDPTGSWTIYHIPACAGDQPIIGVNDDKFVTSANTNLISTICVFSKRELLSGSATIDVSTLTSSFPSVHPVQSLSSTTTEYMVSTGVNVTNKVQLFSVAGVPPGSVTLQIVSLGISPLTKGPCVTQPPSPVVIPDDLVCYVVNTTYDSRVQDAAWYNGKLWYSVNDGCTPTGDSQNRTCIRLTEIDTSGPRIVQDFDFGAVGQYYFYPALRVDGLGNLDVIYGYSSDTTYPSLAVTGQGFNDPSDSLRQAQTLKLGDQVNLSSNYGDYFGAAVDPSKPTLVWVAGEYMSKSAGTCFPGMEGGNCWSTFIGGMTVASDFSISASPSSISVLEGTSGTSAITLKSLSGFSGKIALVAASSSPSLAATFSASTLTLSVNGTGTSTLTASSTAKGSFSITVTGSSGKLSHSLTLIVTVNTGFTMSITPAVLNMTRPASGGVTSQTTTLMITSYGFSGQVNFTNAPNFTQMSQGPLLSYSNSTITLSPGQTAKVTVTVYICSTTPSATFTITGSSTSFTSNATMAVNVSGATGVTCAA